jgi:hypothetical protein
VFLTLRIWARNRPEHQSENVRCGLDICVCAIETRKGRGSEPDIFATPRPPIEIERRLNMSDASSPEIRGRNGAFPEGIAQHKGLIITATLTVFLKVKGEIYISKSNSRRELCAQHRELCVMD